MPGCFAHDIHNALKWSMGLSDEESKEKLSTDVWVTMASARNGLNELIAFQEHGLQIASIMKIGTYIQKLS